MSNMPNPPPTPPRLLRVKRSQQLSASLKRVILTGEALNNFPEGCNGAHIKLMIPQAHQQDPVLPWVESDRIVWPSDDERPIARTYSVANYNAQTRELAVDFVVKDNAGPASSWAKEAQAGQGIGLAGPAIRSLAQLDADWFILLGDLSAIAAIRAALEQLPPQAKGFAFVEATTPEDVIPLDHPEGVQLTWLYRGQTAASQSTALLDALKSLPWQTGHPSITLAGENSAVVAVRQYLIKERQVPRQMMYAVPYWKDRWTEERYHAERHEIMDAFEASP